MIARRYRIFFLATLALTALGRTAFAASPPASLSSSLEGEAKTAYESARSLFEIGDYTGALLKFRHAFDLANDPRLLWNMAACEKEQHHYGRAVALVERYLRDAGPRIGAETRDNAAGTLEALRVLTSRATFTGAPDGARVVVDDETIGTAPLAGPVSLDLGSHTIRVEHSDYNPFEKTVDGVTGGGEMTIAVTMTKLAAARLTVFAAPGDTIAIDSRIVGTERWEANVAPGKHRIRVTATAKVPYDAEVELAPRASRTVHVGLRAESKGAVWPWIVGGVLVAGGAAVGGYLLFKPDDRQGSYTAGGLGTVMLPAGVAFR